MDKNEIINFAILETLRKNPELIPENNLMIYKNITNPNGINYFNFTSSNDARAKMQTISQRDLLQFILEETVKLYNAMAYYYWNTPAIAALQTHEEKLRELNSVFPYYPTVQKAMDTLANPNINSIIYYETHAKELMGLVDAVTHTRYQREEVIRNYVDEYGPGITNLEQYGIIDVTKKIREDALKIAAAKNIQVNQQALNKCVSDVLSGVQLQNQHNEYGLDGNLFASQDIGKRRKNQEDSILILTHPQNKEFKLLVVADGMGGVNHGERASQYLVQELAKWFPNVPVELYNDPKTVQSIFNKKISQISYDIHGLYNSNGLEAGTTIAGAVVTATRTVISSIGDSRVYITKDNHLQLITKDESVVWPMRKSQYDVTDEELDALRFNRSNNKILRCIGGVLEPDDIPSQIIDNSLYDQLIILSDGVTDLLSQEQIKIISTTYPAHLITEKLVETAITNNAIRPEGEDEFFTGIVPAGKDNASAAMFRRR